MQTASRQLADKLGAAADTYTSADEQAGLNIDKQLVGRMEKI